MRSVYLFILLFLGFLADASLAFAQPGNVLLEAIKKNDFPAVKALLDKGSDINVADHDSDNVLMYAALYSTKQCMQLLLENGASPNAKNLLGETPIFWCLNDTAKTSLLLYHRADVNAVTTNGNTPLLSACVGASQGEMIRLLLAHGATTNVKNNRRVTPLLQVALFGDTATARLLLDKGADMEIKAMDQQTVLFFAIKTGNTPMVKWLLDNGANADAVDAYKAKPLSYAVTLNDMDMIKALLSKTTDINAPDIDGMTILMWAIYSEDDHPAIIQLLLDKGATLTAKDKNGETALVWALKKGNTKTVALLEKAGAK